MSPPPSIKHPASTIVHLVTACVTRAIKPLCVSYLHATGREEHTLQFWPGTRGGGDSPPEWKMDALWCYKSEQESPPMNDGTAWAQIREQLRLPPQNSVARWVISHRTSFPLQFPRSSRGRYFGAFCGRKHIFGMFYVSRHVHTRRRNPHSLATTVQKQLHHHPQVWFHFLLRCKQEKEMYILYIFIYAGSAHL